jgi:hypothetical protein
MARKQNRRNTVEAREAIVINVGGRPVEYGRIKVRDRKTGNVVEIDDTDADPIDPGDPGVPYAFKAGEPVPKDHPAVKECPNAFVAYEGVEESALTASKT